MSNGRSRYPASATDLILPVQCIARDLGIIYSAEVDERLELIPLAFETEALGALRLPFWRKISQASPSSQAL